MLSKYNKAEYNLGLDYQKLVCDENMLAMVGYRISQNLDPENINEDYSVLVETGLNVVIAYLQDAYPDLSCDFNFNYTRCLKTLNYGLLVFAIFCDKFDVKWLDELLDLYNGESFSNMSPLAAFLMQILELMDTIKPEQWARIHRLIYDFDVLMDPALKCKRNVLQSYLHWREHLPLEVYLFDPFNQKQPFANKSFFPPETKPLPRLHESYKMTFDVENKYRDFKLSEFLYGMTETQILRAMACNAATSGHKYEFNPLLMKGDLEFVKTKANDEILRLFYKKYTSILVPRKESTEGDVDDDSIGQFASPDIEGTLSETQVVLFGMMVCASITQSSFYTLYCLVQYAEDHLDVFALKDLKGLIDFSLESIEYIFRVDLGEKNKPVTLDASMFASWTPKWEHYLLLMAKLMWNFQQRVCRTRLHRTNLHRTDLFPKSVWGIINAHNPRFWCRINKILYGEYSTHIPGEAFSNFGSTIQDFSSVKWSPIAMLHFYSTCDVKRSNACPETIKALLGGAMIGNKTSYVMRINVISQYHATKRISIAFVKNPANGKAEICEVVMGNTLAQNKEDKGKGIICYPHYIDPSIPGKFGRYPVYIKQNDSVGEGKSQGGVNTVLGALTKKMKSTPLHQVDIASLKVPGAEVVYIPARNCKSDEIEHWIKMYWISVHFEFNKSTTALAPNFF